MAKEQKKDYLNNANLLREILKSQAKQAEYPEEERDSVAIDCLTPELVGMIVLLIDNIAKSWRWRNYTWIEDMKSEAKLNLCRVALKFNLEKAGDHPNPFGYYTQITTRAFLTFIDKEKKQGKIRDEIIESSDTDLLPSHARQTEGMDEDLDGTQEVPNNPHLRRRRKRPKVVKEDDTTKMSESEEAAWLERKKAEFMAAQKVD